MYTHSMFCAKIRENDTLSSENNHFHSNEIRSILQRHVIVMSVAFTINCTSCIYVLEGSLHDCAVSSQCKAFSN